VKFLWSVFIILFSAFYNNIYIYIYIYIHLPFLYRYEKQISRFACCLQKTKSKLFSVILCVNKCISICTRETDWSSYDGGYDDCSFLVAICRRFGGKYCLMFNICIRELLVGDIGYYGWSSPSFSPVFLLGHDYFLPNPSKCINHPIIWHHRLCILK
jgi:hypothetical protein